MLCYAGNVMSLGWAGLERRYIVKEMAQATIPCVLVFHVEAQH